MWSAVQIGTTAQTVHRQGYYTGFLVERQPIFSFSLKNIYNVPRLCYTNEQKRKDKNEKLTENEAVTMLEGKTVLLGITGSIAAYKAAALASALKKRAV